MSDVVLNLGEDAAVEKAFVVKATDPVILPQPYVQPADFAAQYPTPLDTTEILRLCEEVTLLQAIPEERTALSSHTWREMTSLAFVSGSNYLAFADGECPEEYSHNGENQTVDIKNIGAKKTLSIRDIMHSTAVASGGYGINTLVGPAPSGEGLPGANDMATFQRQVVMGVKEKEIRLASTLVLNGEDALLVNGDHVSNSLEFSGIETWATNYSCTFHTNTVAASSGSLSAIEFDRFLSEGCAKPTVVMGHPQAIQELMSAYFQLGYQGSQIVNHTDGNRIIPGYNFGSYIFTGIGTLRVIADSNFARVAAGTNTSQVHLWAFRMTHNGEPMVYRITQVPFGINDLVPGCTAISFQVWKATALVIKACCMHGDYTAYITGRIITTCTVI